MRKEKLFLDFFPNHKYRYIDTTGLARLPLSRDKQDTELNSKYGYDAYFTVNGFQGENARKERCTNLNAFFVDIDGRKDEKELSEIKKRLDPTFIIETKRGYHIYWCLREPIYKDENEEEWDNLCEEWERIEKNLVKHLNADMSVRDIPRVLRIPNTFYWKASGASYIDGNENVFKIKGLHKHEGARYEFRDIDEAFPNIEDKIESVPENTLKKSQQKYATDERRDFFRRVNEIFPVEERDSFKRLTSALPDTLPPNASRHDALMVTSSLMREAGWSKTKATDHVLSVGWHGLEGEKGRGTSEIKKVIEDVYRNGYSYSFKNPVISFNITPLEQLKIQDAYNKVSKEKKETDKIRYSLYEREILINYPFLRKNEIGLMFNYENGVYKMMSDLEISNIVLNGLEEDMLWGFRTTRCVRDKVACLLSIIPDLKISNDGGYIANVRNGLLNIKTRELSPHTPEYVSLSQFPVNYDKNATCPIWENCVASWMKGPEMEAKTDYLQQFAGYLLSSSMKMARALFLVGDGGNGKSTFVDTLSMVLGKDSVSHIDLEALYGQYGMKGLIGKKLNIIEEVEGNYYHSTKLKKIISGEPVTIDIKYKDQFTFRPQAKFIFAVNMMPRMDDTSSATERRMGIIVFRNNFRKSPNTNLRFDDGDLAKELSGILNWMLKGAENLSMLGNFVTTDEEKKMIEEYRAENSSVEGFLQECCVFGGDYITDAQEAYSEYKAFCTSDGRKFKSRIAFAKEMVAYGLKYEKFTFEKRTSGNGKSSFINLKIRDWSDERSARVEYKSF